MSRVDHLRSHPFIVYDEERVRARAYYRFLSGTSGGPLDDWLAAEAEELEAQARERLVYPAIGPVNAPAFEDCYEPAVGFVVHAGSSAPKRMVGQPSPRRCAWCRKSPSEVTFKQDAHLVSETFGNRSLFTLEECDSCNQRHGQQLENHLAKMLIGIRVLGRVKNKHGGVAKAKLGEGRASVGGTPHPEPLRVNEVEGDPSVTFRDVGAGFAELTMPQAKLRPISALRAIGRMAFLAIPSQDRHRYEFLREWVLGERAIEPMKVWRVTYPTVFDSVGVTAWTRCGNAPVPDVVAMFHCAQSVLLIAPTSDAQATIVLPPLPRPSPPALAPSAWEQTFENDKPIEDQWTHKFAGADHYFLVNVKALPVKVRLRLEDTNVVLDGELSTPSPSRPHEVIAYEIVGGTMPGKLSLTTTDGGRTWKCQITGQSDQTLFLGMLLGRGASLTIDDGQGRQVFPRAAGWFPRA